MGIVNTLRYLKTYTTNYAKGFFGVAKPIGYRPSDAVIRAQEERPWLNELLKTYNGTPFRRWLRFENITNETEEMRQRYRLSLAEPTVKAALMGKVLQVASLELRISPKKKKDAYEKQVADFCKLSLQECEGGTTKIIWNIASGGLVDGWSVCEPVWKVGTQGDLKDKWTLGQFKAKDTKYLFPWTDQYRNIIGIQATQYNMGQVYDPKDYVIFQYLQFFENPLGMSDLRAANRAILLKVDVIKLRMTYLDKFTGPFVKGKYADATMRKEMETALKSCRAQGYINLPKEADAEIINMASTGTDDFKSMIDDLDKEIVISVYGAFLHMLEGTNGPDARGDSIVQKSVSELFVWYLASLIAECIKRQILPSLVIPNFGSDVNIPDVVLEAVNPKAILDDLAIDEKLSNLGLDLSKEDLYDRAGRTPPSSDEDRLVSIRAAFIAEKAGVPIDQLGQGVGNYDQGQGTGDRSTGSIPSGSGDRVGEGSIDRGMGDGGGAIGFSEDEERK